PVIWNVQASPIATTSATIIWSTGEPADSQVDYGQTTAYGSSTSLDPTLRLSHSQPLSGLIPSTAYHYRVRSTDAAGHPSVSGDFTFTTATSAANVVWTAVVNVTASGNSLRKTAGCDGCG